MTELQSQPAPPEIVIVNLERSSERRARMSELLAPLEVPYRFFEAVDGRKAPHPLFSRYDEQLALMRRGVKMSAGELGCYASHVLLWEQCVREGRPFLICEDDIEFGPRFAEAYKIASEKIDDYGLLRFSAHKKRRYVICEQVAEGLNIVRYERWPLGASGYLITPGAARRLLLGAEIWFEPVDVHLDRFASHGVLPRGFFPSPVRHVAEANDESEIRRYAVAEAKEGRFRLGRLLYKIESEARIFFRNISYAGQWKKMND